jgi:hypothetical protein
MVAKLLHTAAVAILFAPLAIWVYNTFNNIAGVINATTLS